MTATLFLIWLLTMLKLGYSITFVDWILLALISVVNFVSFVVGVATDDSRGKDKMLTFGLSSDKKN